MSTAPELGTLTPAGDRWALRFSRRLPHPPATVWRAITEPERLAAWFPSRIDGERRAGAPLSFVFEHGEGPTLDGRVLVFEPPTALEFSWGEDVLRFDLEPVDDGRATILRLTDTFDERGKAARDGAGWHSCLAVLDHHLDGRQPPNTEIWADVHPDYVEAFGPEASTLGPPPRP